jgi:hypothetical protein
LLDRVRRVIDQLGPSDVLMATRLDRLARSTRDLLNTLAAIADRNGAFRSARRRMGGHHHIARAADADGASALTHSDASACYP